MTLPFSSFATSRCYYLLQQHTLSFLNLPYLDLLNCKKKQLLFPSFLRYQWSNIVQYQEYIVNDVTVYISTIIKGLFLLKSFLLSNVSFCSTMLLPKSCYWLLLNNVAICSQTMLLPTPKSCYRLFPNNITVCSQMVSSTPKQYYNLFRNNVIVYSQTLLPSIPQ